MRHMLCKLKYWYIIDISETCTLLIFYVSACQSTPNNNKNIYYNNNISYNVSPALGLGRSTWMARLLVPLCRGHSAHHNTHILLQRPTEDDLRSGDVMLGCYLLAACAMTFLILAWQCFKNMVPLPFKVSRAHNHIHFPADSRVNNFRKNNFPLKVSKALATLAALTANSIQCLHWSFIRAIGSERLSLTVGSDKALAFWPGQWWPSFHSDAMCVTERLSLGRMPWECHRM